MANLGTYTSLAAVWAAHPEGGVEGDTVTINSTQYKWDKYDRQWLVSTSPSSNARMTDTYDGDVWISNNLTVGGKIRGNGMHNTMRGIYSTATALNTAVPNPEVGDIAAVGTASSATMYYCSTPGTWTASTTETSVALIENPIVVDNLTTDNGLMALSAAQGKLLKGLVDGKQAALTFDDVPTAEAPDVSGSTNPVKSQGIAKAFESACELTGNGMTIVKSRLRGQFEAGRKYRITLSDPDIDMTGITVGNYDRFVIMAHKSDGTNELIKRRYTNQDLAAFYDITIPDGCEYLYASMRAATGAEQKLCVRDAMADEVNDAFRNLTGYVSSYTLTGSNNTLVGGKNLFTDITAGHRYRLKLLDPDIDMTGVTSPDDHQRFVAIMYDENENGTRIAEVLCGYSGALKSAYEFVAIEGTVKVGAYIRATSGSQFRMILIDLETGEGDGSDSSSTSVTGGGDWLTLSNATADLSGNISKNSKYVMTSPIEGGRGFHLAVNDGYRVYATHLCDRKGNIIGVNYLPPKISNGQHRGIFESGVLADWHSRIDFGSDLILPQHTMRVVICKIDTESDPTKVISTTESIIKRFTYLDNPRLHKIDNENIAAENQLAARTRIRMLTNTLIDPLEDMTASGGAASGYSVGPFDAFFKKGRVRNGIPYSENDIYSKYVGQHVSLYTFMTAMMNRRSVMYTEHVAGGYGGNVKSAYGIVYSKTLQDGNTSLKWGNISNLSANYYGQVCSGFTGYIANLPDVYTSDAYNNGTLSQIGVNRMTEISSPTIDNVEPFDFIWNNGHISIISDIIEDERGKRKFVVIAEQSKPTAYITPLTAERFVGRIAGYSCKVYRWNGWSQVTMPEVPSWLQMDWMDWPRDIDCETDIMTMYGDKPCLEVGDILHLNCRRGDGTNTLYDTVEIFHEDDDPSTATAVSTVDISSTTTYPSHKPESGRYNYTSQSFPVIDDGEDWVDYTVTGLSYGKYKARLKNTTSSTYSGWTRWEMISINLIASNSGGTRTATISVQGGKSGEQWVLRSESSTGITNSPKYLTYGATSSTYSAGKVLKLLVPGDYGVACKIIDISTL